MSWINLTIHGWTIWKTLEPMAAVLNRLCSVNNSTTMSTKSLSQIKMAFKIKNLKQFLKARIQDTYK
jgi:hypothetical protein